MNCSNNNKLNRPKSAAVGAKGDSIYLRPSTAAILRNHDDDDGETRPKNYQTYRQLQSQLNEKGSKILRWIHLHYYPPAMILDYFNAHTRRNGMKLIELTELNYKSDASAIVDQLLVTESPLLKEENRDEVLKCINKLKHRMKQSKKSFSLTKTINCHSMPILAAAFTKSGERFATGSFDKTCKIWNVDEENEITLTGHHDAVSCVAFDTTGEKILTGSYDRTVRVWRVDSLIEMDECLHILDDANGEITALEYNPDAHLCASGSNDKMARVYDLISGLTMYTMIGHTGGINNLQFDKTSNLLLTGSLDSTLGLWDLRTGKLIQSLKGHDAEVSSCGFNYACDKIASSSFDSTVRLWDIRQLKTNLVVFNDNTDEVNEVKWNATGSRLVSASKDGVIIVWDVNTSQILCNFNGHLDSINHISFSCNGALLLSCSDDQSIGLWKSETGESLQTLDGHQDSILFSSFNYLGDMILSISKDNVCKIWETEM